MQESNLSPTRASLTDQVIRPYDVVLMPLSHKAHLNLKEINKEACCDVELKKTHFLPFVLISYVGGITRGRR
ncbi:hypothetical protein KM043_009796 [Ampulex compressa]|nr:hypothetical protein KM043_009796 [Ampulex compressa]